MVNPSDTLSSSDDRGQQFMKLYMGVQRRLYSFVLSMVPSPVDADDIVQETVSVMWTKFDEFEIGTDFAAWALCIARYQIMNYRKRKITTQKRFSNQTIESIQAVVEAGSEQDDERRELLRRCLKKLKDNERKILYFRYEVGSTLRIVAERMGLNINTAYSALSRIHVLLLKCIRKNMIDREVELE